jgi:hypothetical protein
MFWKNFSSENEFDEMGTWFFRAASPDPSRRRRSFSEDDVAEFRTRLERELAFDSILNLMSQKFFLICTKYFVYKI